MRTNDRGIAVPNELDRLRAEKKALDCLMGRHLGSTPLAAIHADVGTRIERLEAEAADPWADAKRWVDEEFQHFGAQHCAARYVRHLEAENAKQAAKIAELEHSYQCEVVDGGAVRDQLKARIAELEARPVPPLDPKRVAKTYYAHKLSYYDTADLGEPYPLKGGDK
jgi:hypothetical protein